MSTYYDTAKPNFTPGPGGRAAAELARVTASPRGWIYTPPAPNTAQVEVLSAIGSLVAKDLGRDDIGILPTFIAGFTSSANTGGTLTSITLGAGGASYGASLTNIPVTVSGGGATTQATATANSNAGGNIISFNVLTPGSGYTSLPTITVGGAGTGATGVAVTAAFNVITAAVLRVTLAASEAVYVSGAPGISVTIGANVRQFVYDSALSTGTSLVFKYAVVVGDVALVTAVTSGASVSMIGTFDGIGDVLTATGGTNWLSTVTFSAPSLTRVSVN